MVPVLPYTINMIDTYPKHGLGTLTIGVIRMGCGRIGIEIGGKRQRERGQGEREEGGRGACFEYCPVIDIIERDTNSVNFCLGETRLISNANLLEHRTYAITLNYTTVSLSHAFCHDKTRRQYA